MKRVVEVGWHVQTLLKTIAWLRVQIRIDKKYPNLQNAQLRHTFCLFCLTINAARVTYTDYNRVCSSLKLILNCCGASKPAVSERSCSLKSAEREYLTKFGLVYGIVVVRTRYAETQVLKSLSTMRFRFLHSIAR